jgi:hypothetical protein
MPVSQPSADQSVQRLIPRRRGTAPASCWAAVSRSGLPSARQGARTDAVPCLPIHPPRGTGVSAGTCGVHCTHQQDSSRGVAASQDVARCADGRLRWPHQGADIERAWAHRSVEARRPHTPASRNGLWFDWSFTAGLCAAQAPGAARAPSPQHLPWRWGKSSCGRPLAAASGCRLLQHFFPPGKHNVIPAGPRQGKRRQRRACGTLTWPSPQGLGEAREGGKKTNAAATGRFAARGRTACFTPRHHGRNWC